MAPKLTDLLDVSSQHGEQFSIAKWLESPLAHTLYSIACHGARRPQAAGAEVHIAVREAWKGMLAASASGSRTSPLPPG